MSGKRITFRDLEISCSSNPNGQLFINSAERRPADGHRVRALRARRGRGLDPARRRLRALGRARVADLPGPVPRHPDQRHGREPREHRKPRASEHGSALQRRFLTATSDATRHTARRKPRLTPASGNCRLRSPPNHCGSRFERPSTGTLACRPDRARCGVHRRRAGRRRRRQRRRGRTRRSAEGRRLDARRSFSIGPLARASPAVRHRGRRRARRRADDPRGRERAHPARPPAGRPCGATRAQARTGSSSRRRSSSASRPRPSPERRPGAWRGKTGAVGGVLAYRGVDDGPAGRGRERRGAPERLPHPRPLRHGSRPTHARGRGSSATAARGRDAVPAGSAVRFDVSTRPSGTAARAPRRATSSACRTGGAERGWRASPAAPPARSGSSSRCAPPRAASRRYRHLRLHRRHRRRRPRHHRRHQPSAPAAAASTAAAAALPPPAGQRRPRRPDVDVHRPRQHPPRQGDDARAGRRDPAARELLGADRADRGRHVAGGRPQGERARSGRARPGRSRAATSAATTSRRARTRTGSRRWAARGSRSATSS